VGHPNWYQGLVGAGQGLGQAVGVVAQRELEEMKDQRAENLARMTFNWHAQHDTAMQARSLEHDTRMGEMHEQQETQREGFLQGQSERSAKDYLDRLRVAQEEAEARQQNELGSRERIESQREIARMRIAMQQDLTQHDANINGLQRQVADAVKNNVSINMITDPQKKAQAMAADPAIGPMLDQLHQEQVGRSKTTAFYTMSLAAHGDNLFQGKQRSDLPPEASSAYQQASPFRDAAPGAVDKGGLWSPGAEAIQDPGAAAAAKSQNWTGDQVQQQINYERGIPNPKGIDSDPNSPDNMAPAMQPGNPATGMPPIVGPARPPVTTNLGPLRASPPQLIPNSALSAQSPSLVPSLTQ
jgi:hypothetical protein